jgi:hypothetical protein
MRPHRPLLIACVLTLGVGVALGQDGPDRRTPRERLRERLKERRERLGGDATGGAPGRRDADARKAVGARPVHGGKLAREAGRVFEVVVTENDVRVYVTDEKGEPLSAKGYAGKVAIGIVRRDQGLPRRANHQGMSAKLGYMGKSKSKGRLRSFLKAKHSLGKADRQALRVDVTLDKLPKHEGGVELRVQLTGTARELTYTCPTGCNKKGNFLDPGTCPKCKETLRPDRPHEAEGGPDHPLRRRR